MLLGSFLALAALAAPVTAAASAQDPSSLPEYEPQQKVTGVLRCWGSQQLAGVLRDWEEGFRKFQPGVMFSDNLKGTATGMLGLEESVADLALMGRQIVPYDTYGIWRRAHRLPVEIMVATGSYDRPQKSYALTVFVHRDNPLARLTLQQLDGIFGAQRTGGWQNMEWKPEVARGADGNIRTWGQLGLTGEWADKPIHPYGPPSLFPGGMSFFQTRVLGGADTWAEDLREYADRSAMVAALSHDPYGIAYTGMCYKTPDVKAVALAEKTGAPFVLPTKETVADRSYPLTRSVYVYFAPDLPSGELADPKVDPKLKEFLRYILSRLGQADVVRAGDYLPLPSATAAVERRKLD